MRDAGIKAVRGYKAPKATHAGMESPAATNLLDRQFGVQTPNHWLVSDITYLHTHEGFLFLAIVMDSYARNIVGWAMGSRMTSN